MNAVFIGIIILLAAHTVNRFLMTEATKKLSDNEKLKIFETFSKRNNYATVFIFVIVIFYFGAIQFLPEMIKQITIVYLVVFTIYLLFKFVSNYRKLLQMQMPPFYIKSFITNYLIFTLGFLGMLGGILWSWFV